VINLNKNIGVDWSRSFLDDQTHQFLFHDLQVNPNALRNPDLLASRCVAHLMALANCSQSAAENCVARAIAEIQSAHSPLSFDIDRSTAYALFVNDRSTGKTRVISTKDLHRYLEFLERESRPLGSFQTGPIGPHTHAPSLTTTQAV
jgi:hypothetical protein